MRAIIIYKLSIFAEATDEKTPVGDDGILARSAVTHFRSRGIAKKNNVPVRFKSIYDRVKNKT